MALSIDSIQNFPFIIGYAPLQEQFEKRKKKVERMVNAEVEIVMDEVTFKRIILSKQLNGHDIKWIMKMTVPGEKIREMDMSWKKYRSKSVQRMFDEWIAGAKIETANCVMA